MEFPSYKSSPTLKLLLQQMEADPNHFKPDPKLVKKMGEELKKANEEYDQELQAYTAWESQQPKQILVAHDFIELGPDWYTRRVTPEKVKWHLDRGLSIEQVAEKLGKSLKTVKRAYSKYGEIPKENPITETPYGWKLKNEKYLPDDSEQWVIEKIGSDIKANKTLDQIAKDFMKIGIKPRGGGLWFPRRLQKVQVENDKMWTHHRSGKTLFFEKGRMGPG